MVMSAPGPMIHKGSRSAMMLWVVSALYRLPVLFCWKKFWALDKPDCPQMWTAQPHLACQEPQTENPYEVIFSFPQVVTVGVSKGACAGLSLTLDRSSR
jgi:hypothetical protein